MAPAQSTSVPVDPHLKQIPGGRVGKTLTMIASAIQSGNTVSEAFQKHESTFGVFFCSIIAKGEESGNIGSAFLKLSEHYEKRYSFQKKIICLLKYPLIILLGASGCFLTLLLFLIPPALQKVWAIAGTMPGAIKAGSSPAIFFQTHTIESLVFPAFIGLFSLLWLWHSNIKFPWLSTLAWKIPITGELQRKNALQRFSLSLSTLLSCSIDPSHALAIAASELRNAVFEKRILHALVDSMSDSPSIFSILKKIPLFPRIIMEMAEERKQTDRADEQFKNIAAFYQDEVEAVFNALMILIGPVFVLVVGLIGLGFLISVS